ncbi:hypothetical protein Nepgr_030048 [Nepenthes gracilis]|uniref:Uncharacterized protein n=1 Tax=Nepenthes gracilis TaxID=150966 RepID=A0AAD3TDU9_NEPGR|nr:hypothetical protein Nepgr_030048 [Nepenthes gracilis]
MFCSNTESRCCQQHHEPIEKQNFIQLHGQHIAQTESSKEYRRISGFHRVQTRVQNYRPMHGAKGHQSQTTHGALPSSSQAIVSFKDGRRIQANQSSKQQASHQSSNREPFDPATLHRTSKIAAEQTYSNRNRGPRRRQIESTTGISAANDTSQSICGATGPSFSIGQTCNSPDSSAWTQHHITDTKQELHPSKSGRLKRISQLREHAASTQHPTESICPSTSSNSPRQQQESPTAHQQVASALKSNTANSRTESECISYRQAILH